VTQTAYERQVSLSSTGFYRTPDIFYDHSRGQGKPFHYYAYGAAVTEIEVNGLTGEHRILRIDVLHDVGHSLVPTVDRGQIEGGFVQGMGWLTREELVWSKDGHLRTHSPDTYKIPSLGEAPLEFHIGLLSRAEQEGVIHGSKAVGEPPFMLALSVITALRHAIQAFRPEEEIHLTIPATPEAVLRAIHNKE
jgi:xanthine dehydrogenase large subunit